MEMLFLRGVAAGFVVAGVTELGSRHRRQPSWRMKGRERSCGPKA